MEQVFFNVPLAKLEPIFKRWIIEAQTEVIKAANAHKAIESDIINIQAAAQLTNRTVGSLYQLTSKDEIPHFKRGGKLYFSRAGLEAWITGQ